MEASQAIIERRMRQHAGFTLVEILIELSVSAFRAVLARIDAAALVRRRQMLRGEFHGMSDHLLRDIGVERSQIDALFH